MQVLGQQLGLIPLAFLNLLGYEVSTPSQLAISWYHTASYQYHISQSYPMKLLLYHPTSVIPPLHAFLGCDFRLVVELVGL